MNPLRYFYIPLLMLMGVALLLTAQDSVKFGWLPIPIMVAIALVYMFGPQIKWWYWGKYPPDLSSRYAPLLDRFPFYLSLGPAQKRDFRAKAFLFRANTVYKAMAMPRVPEDIQVFLAASAACIFSGIEEPDYDKADVVVAYPHPFPSPQIEALHRSEFFARDGVLIFSVPDLVQSVVEPASFIQLGLYEYARVFLAEYGRLGFPSLNWEQIEEISAFKQQPAEKWHGSGTLDVTAVSLVLYFTHKNKFESTFPEVFSELTSELNRSF
ncbi:MAG: hypothetical protein AAFO91_03125 [Bacteroidota bacterium]